MILRLHRLLRSFLVPVSLRQLKANLTTTAKPSILDACESSSYASAGFLIRVFHSTFEGLTLFRVVGEWGGGGGEVLPISVSPVTSATVGISLRNFLTFSFNPFSILV